MPVAQSGISPLIPTLLELYLEVLKEDDALLCGLSLQGLGHFVGIGLNHQDLEKVNQSLLGLLQQPLTTGHTIEEIGRFFYKCAEQNESWFVEKVLVKLLDMAVSGNWVVNVVVLMKSLIFSKFRQSQCDLSSLKKFTSVAPDPRASAFPATCSARTIRTRIATGNAKDFSLLCAT